MGKFSWTKRLFFLFVLLRCNLKLKIELIKNKIAINAINVYKSLLYDFNDTFGYSYRLTISNQQKDLTSHILRMRDN